MTNFATAISIIIVIIVVVPALLTVAYVTVAERKTMASMQRRLGPNVVGYWGSLQAFADALKLLLKEYVSPTQANIILFFLGPIITLVFSLLGYGVIPYGPGLAIWDFDLGILYMLAVSSLATYGILLAGWSANSKYAFLGALRSTAQLISYELILSSAILLVILLTGSLNLTVNTEFQRIIWFTIPLLPVFIIFFIGSVAETNRAPFDLAEAESELVSGFMTEHAAVIFVFFFLAEYGSILLICILNSILFLGGYLYTNIIFSELLYYIIENILNLNLQILKLDLTNSPLLEGLLYGSSLGIKASIMVFTFIWVRASFPRIRYDQLMTYSWTMLLPIVIAFIILVPCIISCLEFIPANIYLLAFWPFKYKKSNNKKVLGISLKWFSMLVSAVLGTIISIIVRYYLFEIYNLDIIIIKLAFDTDTNVKISIWVVLNLIRAIIRDGVESIYDYQYLNAEKSGLTNQTNNDRGIRTKHIIKMDSDNRIKPESDNSPVMGESNRSSESVNTVKSESNPNNTRPNTNQTNSSNLAGPSNAQPNNYNTLSTNNTNSNDNTTNVRYDPFGHQPRYRTFEQFMAWLPPPRPTEVRIPTVPRVFSDPPFTESITPQGDVRYTVSDPTGVGARGYRPVYPEPRHTYSKYEPYASNLNILLCYLDHIRNDPAYINYDRPVPYHSLDPNTQRFLTQLMREWGYKGNMGNISFTRSWIGNALLQLRRK